MNRPPHIEPKHWDEWLASGVAPEIIALNVASISGSAIYDKLCIADDLPRRNDGRLTQHWLKKYELAAFGGWWMSGVDPLKKCEPMEWGCFKPDKPRQTKERVDLGFGKHQQKVKVIKYEHPPRVNTRAFFFRVTFGQSFEVIKGLSDDIYADWLQRFTEAAEINGAPEEILSPLRRGDRGEISRLFQAIRDKRDHKTQPSDTATPRVDRFENYPANTDRESARQFGSLEYLLEQEDKGFWEMIYLFPEVPITITEGTKKGGCLISNGHVELALPGITGGFRTPKDGLGNKIGKSYLIPELAHFALDGREFRICFDSDKKPTTIKNVRSAITKTGRLLKEAGCKVRVVWLPDIGADKTGVDDYIVTIGIDTYNELVAIAPSLEVWESRLSYQLTYPANIRLNQRYLGKLDLPKKGFVVIKSAKGTGKTFALEQLIAEAMSIGQRVIVVGHRILLVREICARLGINYIEEIRDAETGALFGFGLCIDSLHPEGQAKFKVEEWEGAILILDECEQVIWHGLNSSTCYEKRVPILSSLKSLVQTVLITDGLVIAQDADISDISVDYIKGLAEFDIDPFIVINDWKPPKGWDTFFSCGKDPGALYGVLKQKVREAKRAGKAVFVATDSQKSKSSWSTKNLEEQLLAELPELKLRILRADRESTGDPNHPAFGCIEGLNDMVAEYDVIIASPTIATGVSIDKRDYFIGVFGIFKGAIPPSEALQFLARVRDENAPRYVWARKRGVGVIGNGSADWKSIAKSTNKIIKANVKLLQFADFDIESAHDPIHTRTWAKLAARVNEGMVRYRDTIYNFLKEEGHNVELFRDDNLSREIDKLNDKFGELSNQLINAPPEEKEEIERNLDEINQQIGDLDAEHEKLQAQSKAASNAAKATKEAARAKQHNAIGKVQLPTEEKMEELRSKRSRTETERLQEIKFNLSQKYAVVNIDADLARKDEDGWYPKIRSHYYFTHNPEYLKLRDTKHLEGHIKRGNGRVCPQDIKLMTAKILALKKFGIEQFLDPGKELTRLDPELIDWYENQIKPYTRDIKLYLGVTIREQESPIKAIQTLLGVMGLKLKKIKQRSVSGERVRVYAYVPPEDNRELHFMLWELRDKEALDLRKYEEEARKQAQEGMQPLHTPPEHTDTCTHPSKYIDQIGCVQVEEEANPTSDYAATVQGWAAKIKLALANGAASAMRVWGELRAAGQEILEDAYDLLSYGEQLQLDSALEGVG